MPCLSLRVFWTVLAIFSTLACCRLASAREVIRINGTGSGLVVAKPLIAFFQKANRGVSFQMEKSLGSAAAIKALANDALDITVAGRALKPHEMSEKLAWYEYGRIPYAVVTNRQTQMENIASSELAGMYSGRVATWPNGDFVRVILRPREDIDTKMLRALSPEMDRAVTAAHARKDMLLGITDQESFEYLKKTEGEVGFVPLAMPLSEPGSANVSRFDGVAPTLSNLAAGRYPYAKSIVVVTKKETSPGVRKFVQFINSKKGRAIAVNSGLLPSVTK